MIDTMVMNNDEAPKRHGVQPTCKKVKGFQPFQIIWGRKIVDAVFRGGKKHGNRGHTAINMIRDLVRLIRIEYNVRVPIVVRMDAGFLTRPPLTRWMSCRSVLSAGARCMPE